MISLFQRLRPYRWLIVAIAAIAVLRFALLFITPPGFYVDEAASGAHAIALLHHGTDAHGRPWPLFAASLGGGYTTPIYLYPLATWAAVFGSNEVALRGFSLFITLLSCAMIGLAVRRVLGSTQLGLAACLTGLTLPWGWIQGSLAWDPAMVPFFVALSIWMFTILLTTNHRRSHVAAAIILPLSLIALAYVYPPCRVTAPLLLLGYYTILFWRGNVRLRHIIAVAAGSLVLVLPLAAFMFQPDAMARSQTLSVFHDGELASGTASLLLNFLSLMNPIFLFVTGDANLRHSTGVQGMLGLGAIMPLGLLAGAALRHNDWRKILRHPSAPHLLGCVALFGIFVSFLGSALTAEGQPHSLRATAAWPFFVILITLGWCVIITMPRRVGHAALVITACAVLLYVGDLVFLYPRRAAMSFDTSQRQAITNGQPTGYPDLARNYYRWR